MGVEPQGQRRASVWVHGAPEPGLEARVTLGTGPGQGWERLCSQQKTVSWGYGRACWSPRRPHPPALAPPDLPTQKPGTGLARVLEGAGGAAAAPTAPVPADKGAFFPSTRS